MYDIISGKNHNPGMEENYVQKSFDFLQDGLGQLKKSFGYDVI